MSTIFRSRSRSGSRHCPRDSVKDAGVFGRIKRLHRCYAGYRIRVLRSLWYAESL